jgi:hypothetical protein
MSLCHIAANNNPKGQALGLDAQRSLRHVVEEIAQAQSPDAEITLLIENETSACTVTTTPVEQSSWQDQRQAQNT